MKTAISLVMSWFGAIICVAMDSEGAVYRYVQDLLATEDFRNRWNPVLWEEFSGERNDPNGGYLFRFELGFDSGADTLVFLASDRFGSQNCPSWSVYARASPGWTRVASGEVINVETFYVDTPSRTIVQRYPERFGPGMNYSTLRFGTGGSVQKNYYRAEEADEATQDKLSRLGTPFVPVVEKIPIAAYLGSPGMAWRPLDRSHSVSAQSLDAGDAEILTRFGKMDLGRASRLAAMPVTDSRGPDIPAAVQEDGVNHVLSSTGPLNALNPVHANQTPPKFSSINWRAVSAVVTIVFCSVWLLFRRNR